MHRIGRFVRGSITALGVLAVLLAAAPDPTALRAGLVDLDGWTQRDGIDLVAAQLVGVVAWLAALWLAVGIALVAGARLPGTAGRVSAALARGTLPAGLRRTASMALGVSLAASTVSALAGAPAGSGALTVIQLRSSDATLRTDGQSTVDAAAQVGVDWPMRPVEWPAGSSGPVAVAADRALPSAVDWPLLSAEDGSVRPAVDWPAPVAPGTPSAADVEGTVPDADDLATETPVVDWPLAGAASVTHDQAMPAPVDRSLPEAVGSSSAPADGRGRQGVDWPPAQAVEIAADSAAPLAMDGTGRSTTGSRSFPAADRPAPASVDWPLVRQPGGPVAEPGPPLSSARNGGQSDVGLRPSIVDWPVARPTLTGEPAGSQRVLVLVRPGDTLWSIASRRLGPGAPAPAIAAEWRRWHAANRDLIGPDPRRLRAGVSLRIPGGS